MFHLDRALFEIALMLPNQFNWMMLVSPSAACLLIDEKREGVEGEWGLTRRCMMKRAWCNTPEGKKITVIVQRIPVCPDAIEQSFQYGYVIFNPLQLSRSVVMCLPQMCYSKVGASTYVVICLPQMCLIWNIRLSPFETAISKCTIQVISKQKKTEPASPNMSLAWFKSAWFQFKISTVILHPSWRFSEVPPPFRGGMGWQLCGDSPNPEEKHAFFLFDDD